MDLNGLVKLNTSLFTFHFFFILTLIFVISLYVKATGQCLMWKLLVQAMVSISGEVTFSVQPSADSVSCKVLVTQSRLFVQHTPQRAQYGKHTGSPLHRGCGFARGEVD